MSTIRDLQTEKIIRTASVLDITHPPIVKHLVLGKIQYNPLYVDSLILRATTARIGASTVEYELHHESTMSDAEVLSETSSLALVVDLLFTTIIDRQTFGNGHRLTEQIATSSKSPVISLRDDHHSHPSALAEILAIYEHLGALKGKNIGVAWGFGSRFVLPSTAHSLILILAQMGANVRIIEPDKFQLLKRVKRTAKEMAAENDASIDVNNDLTEGLHRLDAVFASNWCRLDDFQHPERNRDHASEFRDWFFTRDNIPEKCYFLSEPPIQHELLASADLLSSSQNLTGSAYLRRVKILIALIQHFIESKNKGTHPTLV